MESIGADTHAKNNKTKEKQNIAIKSDSVRDML